MKRVEGTAATGRSRACLHVSGTIPKGSTYALSEGRRITPDERYRIQGWVRVDEPDAVLPLLRCVFISADGSRPLGYSVSSQYDGKRIGQWQRLEGEFNTPKEAHLCLVTLGKRGGSATRIDAYLDDVRLEPVSIERVAAPYRFEPFPKPLAAKRDVHPRLYFDARKVAELRQACKTTHARWWGEVKSLADQYTRQSPPAYKPPTGPNDQQLWQREVGKAMPTLAMAYLVTGGQRYIRSAQAWALASSGYPTWGVGVYDGMDLAAGHQLYGLAIVYDWCHEALGENARKQIRETLDRRGTAMFKAAATRKVWWSTAYLHNHMCVNACGLGAAGLAVYDEVDGAEEWVGLALDKFRQTMKGLGPDGIWHEGATYWEYSVEHMLKFAHLARDLLEVDLYDHPWWRAAAAHRHYLALPRMAWSRRNCLVDIDDCGRGHWFGPDNLLRALAREFRDGHVQWLADECERAMLEIPSSNWLNLIWYDPTVKPQRPVDFPTFRHFSDTGIVSARTDWSGAESLVVFTCGPVIGHHAIQVFEHDPGSSHAHPDANHFVIFGEGRWLVRDNGYTAKLTDQHNTLLIDGKGQMGESVERLDGMIPILAKARPRVFRAESTPSLDHIAGDAAAAYPPESGLRRFVRHLLFVKPDVLVVIDDIELDKPHSLELRFHPELTPDSKSRGLLYASGNARLRFVPLTPDDLEFTAGPVTAPSASGKPDRSIFTIHLRTKQARWRNAVAFSWSKGTAEPKQVGLKITGDAWRFSSGTGAVTFDWNTGVARYEK